MNGAWAELLLASLRDAGAGDLVVSPGSRSTPLVLAAARLGLASHVLVDERAAGFFALGRARAGAPPPVLICTSGTAGAHYLPAVIEASRSRTPLVMVTADRPPELHDCGAPQTIDQTHLFGRFARGFFDLGTPEAQLAALRGLRRRAAQAVAAAEGRLAGGEPGPVHLNAPARKPLEPAVEPGPAERRMIELAAQVAAEPITRAPAPLARADESVLDDLAEMCRRAERGVLVAGPAPLDPGTAAAPALFALARATGFPLLAETTSQLLWTGEVGAADQAAGADERAELVVSFDAVLASAPWREQLAPDLVIEVWSPATSGAWARMLAADGPRRPKRVVLGPWGWNDPAGGAELMVSADVGDTAARVAARLERPGGAPGGGAWRAAWRDAVAAGRSALEEAVAARESGALSEHAAVRAVIDALPDRALLALGNSLPVRTVDAVCAPGGGRRIGVLSQRGAAGIDGLVAGAAGAADASRRPTVLLLGDVSFAHDVGGLAAARLARAPLAIVVIDNQGGRIFEQLPVAETPNGASLLEQFFLTPPGLDPEAAAAAFGVGFERAASAGAVAEAVGRALEHPGATIVHVRVAPDSARRVAVAVNETLSDTTGPTHVSVSNAGGPGHVSVSHAGGPGHVSVSNAGGGGDVTVSHAGGGGHVSVSHGPGTEGA